MKGTVIFFDLGDTLWHSVGLNTVPFDGVVETIEELWNRGYKIGILSDQPVGTTEAQVRDKMDNNGLESWRFDVVTLSSEQNPPVNKPDPAIFEAALAEAGHASATERTVFITEDLSHILAARDLGWRAIHKPYPGTCGAAGHECISDVDELLDLFPALSADLVLHDSATDPGDESWTGGEFWNSPDLWIRHEEDGGVDHQSPVHGSDNWFYCRVTNRGEGIARIFSVINSVRPWAGTQFIFPYDWRPFTAQAIGANLDSDAFRVLSVKWDAALVPPAATHACWLAQAWATGDETPAGAHVWESNNLAQKNLAIIDLPPGESAEVPIVIGSRRVEVDRVQFIDCVRTAGQPDLVVTLSMRDPRALASLVQGAGFHAVREPGAGVEPLKLRLVGEACVEVLPGSGRSEKVTLSLRDGSIITMGQAGETGPTASKARPVRRVPASIETDASGNKRLVFPCVPVSGLPILVPGRRIVRTILRITMPKDAKPGQQCQIDVVQRDWDGLPIGGVTVVASVRKAGKTGAVKESPRRAGVVGRKPPKPGAGVAGRPSSPKHTSKKPATTGGKE